MANDIMLDLETWGNFAGADIRSIGACVFNLDTGTVATRNSAGVFYVAVDNPIINACTYCGEGQYTGLPCNACENCLNTGYFQGEPEYKYNLKRDPQTVKWWSEQSAEAQGAFTNPVDLMDGLTLFSEWCATIGVSRIWAHGSHYDVPILAAAYREVTGNYGEPWHYRAPRDTRTIFDAAGISDHSAHLASHNTGTHHNALDDALCQAAAVCDAWARIHPRWDDGK